MPAAPRLLPLLPGMLGAALVGAPAWAQTVAAPGETTELQEVVVSGAGEKANGPVKGFVAKRTATGSKTDTPILEVPQSVSTVTADQIVAQGAQNLSQALTYLAGVVGEPFGTDARFDSPLIRGFSAADSIYLNGLKLMRSAGAISLEPYGMERVEVLRGPSSVLYGQGNPGGLVNMVAKRPTWTAFGEVGAEAGTFERYTGTFDVGGPVAGRDDLAYRVTGLIRNGEQQMEDLQDDRYFIAPALTWRPNLDTSLTLLAHIQHDESVSPAGVPKEYSLNAGASGRALDRNFNIGDPNFDESSRTWAAFGYEFSHRFDDTWTVRQNSRYDVLNWDYQGLYYSSLADADTANRGALYQEEDLATFTQDTQVEAKFDTGAVQHTVLGGVDLRHYKQDILTEFGTASSINLSNPSYGGGIAKNVWYSSKVDGTLDQLGLYMQDQMRFERWILTAGLRHDWARNDTTQITNYGNTSTDQTDHAFTTRLGLSYQFDMGLAPYVSYATSFEPVAGNYAAELGGGAFEPTRGEQYEVGIKYQPKGSRSFVALALYDLTQKNVSASETIGGVSYTTQTGEVSVNGFEASALANLTQGLDLIANYTWTDTEITEGDNAGNRLANAPEHAASLWLDYTVQDGTFAGLGFGAGVRYVGERYAENANTTHLDANTLLDAAVRYEKNNYKLSLNVRNIADEAYVSSCGSFGCYWGDGRTFSAKLSYKW